MSYSQKTKLLKDSVGFCQGDSAFVELRQSIDNITSITWTTPWGIVTNTKKIRAQKPGKYYVKITSQLSATPIYDSCVVTIFSKPKLVLRDTVICKGRSIILDAKNPGMQYLWNTFETTQKIKITNPGRYWVALINGNCNTVDTVYIKPLQGSGVVLNREATFCMNEEIRIISVKVNPGTKIQWSTGATSASIYAIKEGNYWVKQK